MICKISGHFEEVVEAPPRALEGARKLKLLYHHCKSAPGHVLSKSKETFPDKSRFTPKCAGLPAPR